MDTEATFGDRRLSGLDAAFLYLERKESPLHIAAVCVFEDEIPFERFVRRVDSRLHPLSRFRQMAVATRFDLSYPTWEDDPHFDIRRHIRRVRLAPPGGEAELEALTGRILGRMMDRSRPLWDMCVIDGLRGGRGALIVRVHHSMGDGIAVMGFMNLILDRSPEGGPDRKPSAARKPRPAPKSSILAAVASGIHSSLQNFISAETAFVETAKALLMNQGALEDVVGLAPELLGAVERLPFNKACGGGRKFCWATFDLAR